jgi:6-phosphogluconolactonase
MVNRRISKQPSEPIAGKIFVKGGIVHHLRKSPRCAKITEAPSHATAPPARVASKPGSTFRVPLSKHANHPDHPMKTPPLPLLFGFAVSLLAAVSPGSAAEPFHLYAPSPSTKQLWILYAKPGDTGLELSVESKVDLGFDASTIAVHPKRPLLYVGGGRGPVEKIPGATVVLDASGAYAERKPFQLKHSTAYLSTDREGRFLLSADYGSGAVDVYGLDSNGFPARWTTGRDEGRREAHCVLPSPDNKFVYIPYVKGNNALLQYRFDVKSGSLTPLDPPNALPPDGTGPRHLAYHPTLPVAYFSNEQHLGVSVYDREANGTLKFRAVCDAVTAAEPKEGISSSDIVITPDGRFIFAGIRGHARDFDWVARYRVDDKGDVTLLGRTPADKIPWGFTLSPDGGYLAVTAFNGGTITVYRITTEGDLMKAASVECDKNISDIAAR